VTVPYRTLERALSYAGHASETFAEDVRKPLYGVLTTDEKATLYRADESGEVHPFYALGPLIDAVADAEAGSVRERVRVNERRCSPSVTDVPHRYQWVGYGYGSVRELRDVAQTVMATPDPEAEPFPARLRPVVRAALGPAGRADVYRERVQRDGVLGVAPGSEAVAYLVGEVEASGGDDRLPDPGLWTPERS
jgi:hypothetical protein